MNAKCSGVESGGRVTCSNPGSPWQVWGHSNPRSPRQVWGHSSPTGPTAGLGSQQPRRSHSRSVPTISQGTASAPSNARSGQDHLPQGRSLSHLPIPGVRAWGEQPPLPVPHQHSLSRVPHGHRGRRMAVGGEPGSRHFLILMAWLVSRVGLQHGFSG